MAGFFSDGAFSQGLAFARGIQEVSDRMRDRALQDQWAEQAPMVMSRVQEVLAPAMRAYQASEDAEAGSDAKRKADGEYLSALARTSPQVMSMLSGIALSGNPYAERAASQFMTQFTGMLQATMDAASKNQAYIAEAEARKFAIEDQQAKRELQGRQLDVTQEELAGARDERALRREMIPMQRDALQAQTEATRAGTQATQAQTSALQAQAAREEAAFPEVQRRAAAETEGIQAQTADVRSQTQDRQSFGPLRRDQIEAEIDRIRAQATGERISSAVALGDAGLRQRQVSGEEQDRAAGRRLQEADLAVRERQAGVAERQAGVAEQEIDLGRERLGLERDARREQREESYQNRLLRASELEMSQQRIAALREEIALKRDMAPVERERALADIQRLQAETQRSQIDSQQALTGRPPSWSERAQILSTLGPLEAEGMITPDQKQFFLRQIGAPAGVEDAGAWSEAIQKQIAQLERQKERAKEPSEIRNIDRTIEKLLAKDAEVRGAFRSAVDAELEDGPGWFRKFWDATRFLRP